VSSDLTDTSVAASIRRAIVSVLGAKRLGLPAAGASADRLLTDRTDADRSHPVVREAVQGLADVTSLL
jgi:hypothetical protein